LTSTETRRMLMASSIRAQPLQVLPRPGPVVASRRNVRASKSKTFNVPVKTLFRAWADSGMRRRWLDDVKTVVRTATAPKSMRLQWPDGTIVSIWFTPKGETKSVVGLAHTKLRDKAASNKTKTYWGDRLDALATLFAATPIKN
jgi:hypothetical protein